MRMARPGIGSGAGLLIPRMNPMRSLPEMERPTSDVFDPGKPGFTRLSSFPTFPRLFYAADALHSRISTNLLRDGVARWTVIGN